MRTLLRLQCCNCSASIEVTSEVIHDLTCQLARQHRWVLSAVDSVMPAVGKNVLAPTCHDCAEKIYGKSFVRAALERIDDNMRKQGKTPVFS